MLAHHSRSWSTMHQEEIVATSASAVSANRHPTRELRFSCFSINVTAPGARR